VLTGIIFVLKTGVPWEHLPATSEFPSGQTCLRWLRKWQKQGVWSKLLTVLLSELRSAGKIDWRRAIVDSASVRAPHGGRKTGPSPVDRRKLGSKHHLITDARGVPLAVILTAANRHDITQLLPLVEKIPALSGRPGHPRHRPRQVQGDRGYDSQPHRKALKKKASAPSLPNGEHPMGVDWENTAGSWNGPCPGCISSENSKPVKNEPS
jgi:transposase